MNFIITLLMYTRYTIDLRYNDKCSSQFECLKWCMRMTEKFSNYEHSGLDINYVWYPYDPHTILKKIYINSFEPNSEMSELLVNIIEENKDSISRCELFGYVDNYSTSDEDYAASPETVNEIFGHEEYSDDNHVVSFETVDEVLNELKSFM